MTQQEMQETTLPLFKPQRSQTPLNPAALLNGAPLGVDGLAGLRLYHHSQCFESVETESPQRRARVMEQHLETWEPSSPIASQTLRIEENIKGAAHHLDATFSCPRRYWLEHVRGWATEPFLLPNTAVEPAAPRWWPLPTTFGLMMHRVLEICLLYTSPSPRDQ